MNNQGKGKLITLIASIGIVLVIIVVVFVGFKEFYQLSYAYEDSTIVEVKTKNLSNQDGVSQSEFVPFEIKPYEAGTYEYTIWLEKEGKFKDEIYFYITSSKENEIGQYFGNNKCYDYEENKYIDTNFDYIYLLDNKVTTTICGYDFNPTVTTKAYGDIVEMYNFEWKEYGKESDLACKHYQYVWNEELKAYIDMVSENEKLVPDSECRFGVVYNNPTIIKYSNNDKMIASKGIVTSDEIINYQLRYWTKNSSSLNETFKINIDLEKIN